MWNSLFKIKDNHSLLKNFHFRSYLSQTQFKSIQNKLDNNKLEKSINMHILSEKSNKNNEIDLKFTGKEEIDFVIEEYLDKINHHLNNKGKLEKTIDKKLINSITFFKIPVLLFAFTTLTSTIGYFFYLQYQK